MSLRSVSSPGLPWRSALRLPVWEKHQTGFRNKNRLSESSGGAWGGLASGPAKQVRRPTVLMQHSTQKIPLAGGLFNQHPWLRNQRQRNELKLKESILPITPVSVLNRGSKRIRMMSKNAFMFHRAPSLEIPGGLSDGARDLRCPSLDVILGSTLQGVNAIKQFS